MIERQDDTVAAGERGAPAARMTERSRGPLYTRTMPGGGYVHIELLVSDPGDVDAERRRGRLVIEPWSASPRHAGNAPLVVEVVEGDDENTVVTELFRIAQDNAAIARRVLRRRTSLGRAD